VSFESLLRFLLPMLNGLDLQTSDKRCLELERQHLDEVAEYKKKISICVMKLVLHFVTGLKAHT